MKIDRIDHENNALSHLHCHTENFSAKIFPNLGASLQEFVVSGQKIIDGISIDQNGLEDYASTYKSSVLFPFPNRIEDGKYSFEGNDYQLNINEKPLNNAIHGLVFDKHFRVHKTESENDEARLELTYESAGELPGFPFQFVLKLIYEIHSSGYLKLSFEVLNNGIKSFPYGMGWHPYFATEHLDNHTLSFSSKDHFLVDSRMIPVDRKASALPGNFQIKNQGFDDAFLLDNTTCQLKGPSYLLNLSFDSENQGHFQIYTPEHRKNIALEPMTCVANSFNNRIGYRKLEPGQMDSWNIEIEIDCN